MTTVAVTAAGIVGSRLLQYLGATHTSTTVVHDPRVAPLDDLAAGDVVVVSHPGPHGALMGPLLRRGVSVVGLDDGLDTTAEILDLDDDARAGGATLVVGAGMAPGLAGLLARHLAAQLALVDEIHVAVHGTAGPACARQHHRALAGRAVGWHDGSWVERPAGSGRELCWFPEPVGPLDCYRAELAVPLVLQRVFQSATRISVRRSGTRRDRLTSRLPMLRPPHAEGGLGALRVEVRGSDERGGRTTLITGIAELVGTATAATASVFVEALCDGALPDGVVIPGDDRLDTAGLLDRIAQRGVRLQEFTGVPHV
jgi:hypothetical protein